MITTVPIGRTYHDHPLSRPSQCTSLCQHLAELHWNVHTKYVDMRCLLSDAEQPAASYILIVSTWSPGIPFSIKMRMRRTNYYRTASEITREIFLVREAEILVKQIQMKMKGIGHESR